MFTGPAQTQGRGLFTACLSGIGNLGGCPRILPTTTPNNWKSSRNLLSLLSLGLESLSPGPYVFFLD